MSSREFAEHYADYRLEPWGDDWEQVAQLSAFICNSSGNYKKTIHPDDVKPGKKAQKQSSARQMMWQIDQMMHLVKARQEVERKRRDKQQAKRDGHKRR